MSSHAKRISNKGGGVKRPHSDSPVNQNNISANLGVQDARNTHSSKRVKLSPANEAVPLPSQPNATGLAKAPVQVAAPEEAKQGNQRQQSQNTSFSDHVRQDSASSIITQARELQAQQNQQQAALSASEVSLKREEVKTQMRQFMAHLGSMAKTGQITVEKAKSTAEKVRAEAVKK